MSHETSRDLPAGRANPEVNSKFRFTEDRSRRVLFWATLLAATFSAQCLVSLQAEPPVARFAQYPAGGLFDLRNASIPREDILPGGPPKDGIPALTDPPVISAEKATYLTAGDRVAGVRIGEQARAYPLRILTYHEVVNDHLAGVPIAVTYCPLCDSLVVFDRRTDLGVLEFGVSGLLYNSNVLMYDRGGRPESLWSQIAARGVSGPGAGKELKTLPVVLTTWADWRARFPHTTVLSPKTGHVRDYGVNPYARYFVRDELMFPVRPLSRRLPLKTPVLGVWVGNQARAYPLSAFDPAGQTLEQQLAGKKFQLRYDAHNKTVTVSEAADGVHWMYSFWFAWYAFRPQTEVFQPRR